VLATIALVWFTPELAPRAKELGPQVRDIGLDLSAELGFHVPLPCNTSAFAQARRRELADVVSLDPNR
jgi:hypothetical protein